MYEKSYNVIFPVRITNLSFKRSENGGKQIARICSNRTLHKSRLLVKLKTECYLETYYKISEKK